VISIFSGASYQHLKEKSPKKPILVDFMEHKEGLSPEPASLSPAPMARNIPAQDLRPRVPPPTPAQRPSVEAERGRAAKAGKRKEERKGVSKRQREEPVEAPPEEEKFVDATPRTLPSAKDLIPSMSDLMSWQTQEAKYHRSPFEQDGVADTAARVQYDAYLSILKQRVKQRWVVSTVREVRDATTVVLFTVGNDGSLQYLEIAKSSGRVNLDRRAVAAIRDSFPLPKPPKRLLDENGVINIQFSFRYMVYSPYFKSTRKDKKGWTVD
jgi:TonB family protein